MRAAITGAVGIALVSTFGDFVWAGFDLRHRMVFGLAHGTLLFLCIGAYLGSLERMTARGAIAGAIIGLSAAGSFYIFAPVAGYSVMFFVWAFIWLALAALIGRGLRTTNRGSWQETVTRGLLAMIGSGLGFYLISDIWRPFNPRGWDYAVHFLSWTIAYLPGFLALLAPRVRLKPDTTEGVGPHR
jgi:hypothetical protein